MFTNNRQVGQRIRYARNARGLTSREIAKKLGVSAPTVTRYEVGEFKVSLPMLQAIGDVLEVSPEWLLGCDNTPTRNQQDNKILTAYRKADPKIQDAVLRLLDLDL